LRAVSAGIKIDVRHCLRTSADGPTKIVRRTYDSSRTDAPLQASEATGRRPADHLQALAGRYETRHVGLYKTAVAVRFRSSDRLARRPRAFRPAFGFGACFLRRLLEIIVVEPLATVETALEAGQRRPVAGSAPIRPPTTARRSKRLLGPCARRERQGDRNRVVDRLTRGLGAGQEPY
jgi:hypothetical protein